MRRKKVAIGPRFRRHSRLARPEGETFEELLKNIYEAPEGFGLDRTLCRN